MPIITGYSSLRTFFNHFTAYVNPCVAHMGCPFVKIYILLSLSYRSPKSGSLKGSDCQSRKQYIGLIDTGQITFPYSRTNFIRDFLGTRPLNPVHVYIQR